MGFFDALFGGGNKNESKKTEPASRGETERSSAEGAQAVETALGPELIAVIAAAAYSAMATQRISLRISRANRVWAATGRQKIMDARQFA